VEFFGADRRLDEIDAEDAEAWVEWFATSHPGTGTRRPGSRRHFGGAEAGPTWVRYAHDFAGRGGARYANRMRSQGGMVSAPHRAHDVEPARRNQDLARRR
jgi:hypothetical protein